MPFQKAQKYDSKLRMSIAGPSGSGKTYTALILATALAGGAPVAVIDTERGSASKYADLFAFDVMELDTFHPQKFIDAIHEAEAAGYAVLVIDSLSHAWSGTGGLLEVVDAIAKRKNTTNTFAAWKDATPLQNALIDAITRAKLHVLATMRSKQEYALETVNGKAVPRKVGMAPVQRDGMEYEFDVAADMDIDNTLIVQKSRCPQLSGAIISKPDAKVADILKLWLHGVKDERPVAVQPVLDPAEVSLYVGGVYKFQSSDFEKRWTAYKQHVLGEARADADLSQSDLSRLRTFAADEDKREKAHAAKTPTNGAKAS